MNVVIEDGWRKALTCEFEKPYFAQLRTFVRSAYTTRTVFPPPKDIFRAFDLCPFDAVRVVILGQDPYHNTGQATGLCFAVNEGTALPPSLQNIFKEIESDVGAISSRSGDLSRWASQGVLLLNSVLTVEAHKAASHQGVGWERFTDAVIQKISDEKRGVVFMLWGNYAKKKGERIDRDKHLVLTAAHPSPLSAHNGFFGCKHFSQANAYLEKHNPPPIIW